MRNSTLIIILAIVITAILGSGCTHKTQQLPAWQDIERVSIPVAGGRLGFNGRVVNVKWHN